MSAPVVFVAPKTACLMLGVHRNTLRRWEDAGRFPNLRRLPGGHRRYFVPDLRNCLAVAA